MTIADWLMILAVVVSPIIALQLSKWIEKAQQGKSRKLWIFYTLMSTRRSRVSTDHVNALNTIDFAFYGRKILGKRIQTKKEKDVTDAWKIYLDHLNEQFEDKELNEWSKKGEELFIKLLHVISLALKYEFNQVELIKGIYSPRAHSDQAIANLAISESLMKILIGKESLPVKLIVADEALERQEQLVKATFESLSPERVVKVKIVE